MVESINSRRGSWQEGSPRDKVDYEETFSPIAGYASIQVFISISSVMRWRIHQMDVKTTFLNEIIKEEVYIEKPQGFKVHGRESHVCARFYLLIEK
jgi:hypothetical protein